MSLTLEECRARDAKALIAFLEGRTNIHPHGESGRRWFIPPILSSNCRDARDYRFSEWANHCGITFEGEKSA